MLREKLLSAFVCDELQFHIMEGFGSERRRVSMCLPEGAVILHRYRWVVGCVVGCFGDFKRVGLRRPGAKRGWVSEMLRVGRSTRR
jgi:hypothetical protein